MEWSPYTTVCALFLSDRLQHHCVVPDPALEWLVGGLHEESSDKLIQLMDATKGFKCMTPEEDQSIRQAIKVLFLNGWKLGLAKLNAESGSGGVQGQLMLELEAGTDGQLNFEKKPQA